MSSELVNKLKEFKDDTFICQICKVENNQPFACPKCGKTFCASCLEVNTKYLKLADIGRTKRI